ncbi:hypothetical protein DUI87_08216 [Hirundo rustica rustica]|uniref:Uncharacterized protein n=1 Tax=Hirundo rustica rustica TaxID=333673 RepID=A0A3M0KRU4_HIRRU|nr:hypothetical protein DUI87_08216 [Hirundo rustica rustica]
MAKFFVSSAAMAVVSEEKWGEESCFLAYRRQKNFSLASSMTVRKLANVQVLARTGLIFAVARSGHDENTEVIIYHLTSFSRDWGKAPLGVELNGMMEGVIRKNSLDNFIQDDLIQRLVVNRTVIPEVHILQQVQAAEDIWIQGKLMRRLSD